MPKPGTRLILPVCLLLRDFASDLSCLPTPPWCPALLAQGSCTAYLPGDLLGVCGNRKAAEMLHSDPQYSPRSVPSYLEVTLAGKCLVTITFVPGPTITVPLD